MYKRQAERARRFGFTATEYDRARANYLQAVESAYNEREKTKSGSYAVSYTHLDVYKRQYLLYECGAYYRLLP